MIWKTLLLLSVVFLTSCGLNPQHVDVDMTQTLPETKTTTFSQSILDLGKMNRIYGGGKLHIMSKDIIDNTGTSIATNAEIPRDVTEMLKSTLNGIGGDIIYIPYDPEFMVNTANTGYSDWGAKLLPDVLVSGGITEFDRGLVTKGENLDFDVEGSAGAKPLGLEFSDQRKSSVASITLDFNLIDFRTFAGIPRMQAINNIKVNKALGEDTVGFTIYGATMGLKGSIKKIQGRHEAVRLLVQLSMIQIIGKYQTLPYWRVIPGAETDLMVMEKVTANYLALSQGERIAKFQEYMYLQGYDVLITGFMDSKTANALSKFRADNNLSKISDEVDLDAFLAAFINVPIDLQTVQRRKNVERLMARYRSQPQQTTLANARKALAATPKKKQPSAVSRAGKLDLWTNKTEFSIGDALEINFEVDTPMYVRIVTVNSDGQVATLFPNPHQSDNYCLPGKQYQIPPATAKFALSVGGPSGTDKIRAIAASQPVIAESMKLTQAGEFDAARMDQGLVRAAVNITVR